MPHETRSHLPSELRFDASDTSLATLSSLKLPGMRLSRVPDSESSLTAGPCSEALVPHRFRATGECVADLWRRMVEKRLTKEVLCLNLNLSIRAGICILHSTYVGGVGSGTFKLTSFIN